MKYNFGTNEGIEDIYPFVTFTGLTLLYSIDRIDLDSDAKIL